MSTSLLRKAISLFFLLLLIVSPTIENPELIEAGRSVMEDAFSIVANESQNAAAQAAADHVAKNKQTIPPGFTFVAGPISDSEGKNQVGVVIIFPKVSGSPALDAKGVKKLLETNITEIQTQVARHNTRQLKFNGIGTANGVTGLVTTLFFDLSAKSHTTRAGPKPSFSSKRKSTAPSPQPKSIRGISLKEDGLINKNTFNLEQPENYKFTWFQQESLEAHNKQRALHDAPELILSKQLCDLAKTLLRDKRLYNATGQIQHSRVIPEIKSGCGENLFWSNNWDHKKDAKKPVVGWYNEICDYFPNESRKNTGHFTQVVWKGEYLSRIQDGTPIWDKKQIYLGIDWEENADGINVFAVYYPPGNVGDIEGHNSYKQNVSDRNPKTEPMQNTCNSAVEFL